MPDKTPKKATNLEPLFNGLTPQIFRKKSVIVTTGQPIEGLYRVVSGRIKVTATTDDGQELTLNTVGPGDPFPLPLFFNIASPELKYTAETAVKAVWRPRAEVDAYLHSNPLALYHIIRMVLQVLYGRISTLSRGSADERVIKRLIELSERWAIPDEDLFEITTTQQELADSVSLSRESVNMVMKRLVDKDILKMSRGKIFMSIAKAKAELCRGQSGKLHQMGALATLAGDLHLMG